MTTLRRLADDGLAARDQRKAAGKSNFNADKTRYISREFLGWCCYIGSVRDDGNFAGQRVGVVTEEGLADQWLGGDDTVKWDIPADPFGNLRG